MYMERLHVESSDWTCEYDNVAIAGLIGTANDPVNFCGDMYNILVQSEGNQAIITFYSDDSDNRKGFTLRYETFSHGAAVPIFTPYPQRKLEFRLTFCKQRPDSGDGGGEGCERFCG